MATIVLEELTKRFPGEPRAAVDAVSLSIEPGSFVALIGPSGCGKTTLLKLLNRLYEPTEGRVLIDDVDIASSPATELRRRIGYVIQQSGLFPHMRIEQNIAVVPELLGWDRERIRQRTDELMELIGLPPEYRRRYPRQLSGGQQQRVGLARALAADPAIMLMDEPFGALDAITRLRLQDELLDIQRKLHKTIVFVTHDMEEALRLADVVVVMNEGQIVQSGPPLEIVSRPASAFVENLVGAGDMLRRLSLLNAGQLVAGRRAARTAPPQGPQVSADGSLRDALAALIGSEADAVTVVDGAGASLGRLSFEDIRSALAEPSEREA
ncbi:ABC transporter ATP-binding protein [Chloroflexia bacterium SDU3-3]|nr:ABC transporter ATP-binding protein [Chloroflexia bacterium SDU3-3]